MPKDKEKTVNPAAAARKAEKARAIKKGKAAVAQQRTERLSQINPARIERQLADLHARQASQGGLPARERRQIEELEKDLERIRKARTAKGTSGAPSGTKRTRDQRDGRGGERDGRWRDGGRNAGESESENTDESTRRIPMPRDTPPPVPTRRRPARFAGGQDRGGNAADETQPAAPPVEAKTVYEAKPQIRNLQREAVGFVPSVVRQKIQAAKGQGGRLLEEDELDALEKQGYVASSAPGTTAAKATDANASEDKDSAKKPPMQVEMEEVSDEDL